MENVLAVANAFIRIGIENKNTVPLAKLCHLLFYAQGFYMFYSKGKPLFEDDFIAVPFGPSIPRVQKEFFMFGDLGITKFGSEFDEKTLTWKEPVLSDPDINNFLKSIWDIFGRYSSEQLKIISSLKDHPFTQVYDEFIPNRVIDKNLIFAYAEETVKRARAMEKGGHVHGN